MLAPVIGGQPVPAANASGEVGVVLTPVIGGRPTDNRVRVNRKRSAADRYVDSWKIAGVKGKWVRSHRTPRRCLFTPHRVAGGPTAKDNIGTTQITKGTFIGSGREFDIEDDYSVERDAHRMLEGAWTGTTKFQDISGDIDNDENKVDRDNEQHNMGENRGHAAEGESKSDRIVWADCDYESDDDHEVALNNIARQVASSGGRTLPPCLLGTRAVSGVGPLAPAGARPTHKINARSTNK